MGGFIAPLKWAVIDMIKTYTADFSGQLGNINPDIKFLFISGTDDQVIHCPLIPRQPSMN